MKNKTKEIQKAVDNRELIIPLSECSKVNIGISKYTDSDMRAAFIAGADYARSHSFTPPTMNAVKAREEAGLRWPS